MTQTILVLNAGSSSVKFSLFEQQSALNLLATGRATDIGGTPQFKAKAGATSTSQALPVGSTHVDALHGILDWIETQKLGKVAVAAHRIVHGGANFRNPVVLTPVIMEQLRNLIPLAPLHQPHNLAAIDILNTIRPDMPQIACFDTGFHAGHDPLFDTYALSRELRDKGVRRYGFHGLSYEWIASALKKDYPALAKGRVVVAHLGNGASLCAMNNAVGVDTTMGMTALEGLPMGTRCGNLDPGAVIFMLRELGMSPKDLEYQLYNKCGLKGLSEISNDVQTLQESADPKATFALDFFCLKIAQYISVMAVSAGGMDALVFTGGIGENAEGIRRAVLDRLAFFKPFETLIIPTNEEGLMAQHAYGLILNK